MQDPPISLLNKEKNFIYLVKSMHGVIQVPIK